MVTPLFKKLRIQENDTLLTINAPSYFKKSFPELPSGVSISTTAKNFNQVHWFVKDRSQMEKELGKVLKLIKDNVTIWAYYPKGSSGIQTDLTRDKGWDKLLAEDEKLTWVSLISFNDTWSVFGFRPKTTSDKKKKAAKPAQREIFNWVKTETKEVKLPGELSAAFKKNRAQAAFFETLSFTNKKEYIEWIVTAKREETKAERVAGTIERLGKKWKNPANR
ncbi:YdeI/OmpD-associated family protein [Terrimonas sp. NA20]|uniref:YdeI/OmpD-associated family protein n=1 Tax=Terrimonas ginsenosidimutans TaxID=2908004 RepID=A0ABS9KMM4_9BACT|nr:YdeI/OmpD-associated family protein [Terrimonas ginsenosidimutans]MCG2613573.1 YdeI/OmpD-associated family protein [Terrimonas ginsenosidimutans]